MTTIIINTHHTIQRVNVQRLDESLDELLSPHNKKDVHDKRLNGRLNNAHPNKQKSNRETMGRG